MGRQLADITTLGLAVDSRQVRTATGDLDRFSAAGERSEKATAGAEAAFSRLNTLLKGYIGLAAVRQVILQADAYTNLNARLRLVTAGTQEFATAQTALFGIAQETRTGLEQTSELFGKLSVSTESLGVSQAEVLGVTESINKALQISGGNAQSAAAALVQLGQGFASGTLRGEELNSVLEQAPRLARAIADGLGVPIGKLRELGEQGKLTSQQVFQALQGQAGAIEREFGQLPLTVGGAVTQAQNALLKLIGTIDETSGASQGLAGVISDTANAISGLADEIARVSEGKESVSVLANAFVTVREVVTVLFAEIKFVLEATGREIGAIAAQIVALGNLDIKGFRAISEAVKEDAERARAELDKFTRNALLRLPDLGQTDSKELARRGRPATPFGRPQPAFESKSKGSKKDPFADAIKGLREQIALVGKESELEQISARIALGNYGKLSAAQSDRLKGLAAELDAKKNLQAQEDARLDIDLAGIRRQLDGLTGSYAAAEAILEAQRQAGLIGERDYYEQKRGFIAKNEQAQVKALEAENAKLAAEEASGDKLIKNQERIADNDVRIAQIRTDAAAQTKVLSVQEQAAYAQTRASIEATRAALEGYLATLTKAQQREVDGLGLGEQERSRRAGRADIEDQFEAQRQELLRARRQAELTSGGNLTAEQEARYQAELKLINDFQARALQSYDFYYAERLKKEQSFNVGASEALQNYLSEARNVAKQTEEIFSNAFQGLEDTLTEFITTGKGSFRDFADSIAQDIVRATVKQNLGKLFEFVSGSDALSGIFGSPNRPAVGAPPVSLNVEPVNLSLTALQTQGIDPTIAALLRLQQQLNLTAAPVVTPGVPSTGDFARFDRSNTGEQSIADLFQEPATDAESLGNALVDTRTSAQAFTDVLGLAAPALASLGKAGSAAGVALSVLPSLLSVLSATGASKGIGEAISGAGSLFSGGGFGDIASFFGGFFANGGDPPLGKVSVVGEKGPELFVPKNRGTIVPLAEAKGSDKPDVTVINHNNFHLSGPVTKATQEQIAAAVNQSTRRAAVRGTA